MYILFTEISSLRGAQLREKWEKTISVSRAVLPNNVKANHEPQLHAATFQFNLKWCQVSAWQSATSAAGN